MTSRKKLDINIYGLIYLRKDDASQTIIIQNNKDLHKFGIAAQN